MNLQQQKEEKKQNLMASAYDLFMEKGFVKTTVDEIVRRANVAKGTFYLYFKDKYDLRDKLVVYKAGQLFTDAHNALKKYPDMDFEKQFLFVTDYLRIQ